MGQSGWDKSLETLHPRLLEMLICADKVGYEINFNRYVYKPKGLRTLEET